MATPTKSGTSYPTDAPVPKAGFPAFQTETFATQLVWLAITFGLLYYLMAKIALPKVAAILQERSERIAGDLEQAQKMRDEAEAASAAYEASLAQARDKAKGIAQETRDKLTAESDANRKQLEEQLATKLAEAEATIAAGTQAAMANVRNIAGEAAGAIVERLTGRPAESKAIESALDRTAPRG